MKHRARQRLCSSLVVSLALLHACAPSRHGDVRAAAADPRVIYERLREEEQSIRSLRARFVATTVRDGAERRVQGVLVVRKPDRFRLRLVLPFGLTLFDYLSVGERAWSVAPLSDVDAPDFTLFSREDLGAAFLRTDGASSGKCEPAAVRRGFEVACRACSDCPVERTFLIEPANGAILEETAYDERGPRVILRYGAHREVDGRLLPFRIRVQAPGREPSVAIRIQHYEVNPALAQELFRPVPGSRVATGRDPSAPRPSPVSQGTGR